MSRTKAQYVDPEGREWSVREIVDYGSAEIGLGKLPPVVRRTVVFESGEERRVLDHAPPDWRTREGAVGELFAQAREMR